MGMSVSPIAKAHDEDFPVQTHLSFGEPLGASTSSPHVPLGGLGVTRCLLRLPFGPASLLTRCDVEFAPVVRKQLRVHPFRTADRTEHCSLVADLMPEIAHPYPFQIHTLPPRVTDLSQSCDAG